MEKEAEDSSRQEHESQEPLQMSSAQRISSVPKEETGRDQNDVERVLTWQKTHESQHSRILGLKPKDEQAMLSMSKMGRGRPYPPELPGESSEYVVEFDGPDDPTHPQNWPMSTK